jgi:four helix bundle protein
MDVVELSYGLARGLPADERFALASQIRRSAVAIPPNIAEGHGRLHRGDFAHHLSIASGSLRELETQVLIAARLGYAQPSDIACLTALMDEVGRMLAGLIKAVRKYPTPD